MVYRYGKRLFDLLLALVALMLLAPVFLAVAVAIRLDTPGPLLFRLFQILKFRTMRVDTPSDVPTSQLDNPDHYISKVGRFLRRTSLDELPQLINIVRGEMSFVGPRPVLAKEQELIYMRERFGANDVLPGLTGWAQINGRDELTNKEKARFDGEYVKNRSFLFDFYCIVRTFVQVVQGHGVVEGRRIIVPEAANAPCLDDTDAMVFQEGKTQVCAVTTSGYSQLPYAQSPSCEVVSFRPASGSGSATCNACSDPHRAHQ
jgi:O-antigen biosynthesis protein WbqP